ncbi:hypothetical protein [Paraburkholderia caribensis]|nr:hypothetical protein [Paraburkholderia caribensis]
MQSVGIHDAAHCMANFAPLIRDGGRIGGRFGRTEIRHLCASAYNSRNDCAPDGAMSRAPLQGMTAGAPYEESRRKPAFWNHRPEFAPNRHGFRAPDRLF